MFDRIAKAFFTPLKFSIASGHFYSCLLRKSVDIKGNPIPMLTYRALAQLSQIDLSQLSILEFGTGQSSLYFAPRVKKLTGVEQNRQWADYVNQNFKKINPEINHTKIYVCEDIQSFQEILNSQLLSQYFDIIIIDGVPYPGGSRLEAAEFVLKKENRPKLIILDNSDLPLSLEIKNLFHESGYVRIDFVGHSPAAYFMQCTSFLFEPVNTEWIFGRNQAISIRHFESE